MASYGEPIPKIKKWKRQPKNSKIKQANVDPSYDGKTYVIDRLNIGEATNYSKSESK